MTIQLDEAKIQLSKQTNRIQELESLLNSHSVTIKILKAEKEHSITLQHHMPSELTNQNSRMSMRPRSAENFRKPNYKISEKTSRGLAGTLGHKLGEFSIALPSQDSQHGYTEILDLEEHPEAVTSLRTMTLGPTVVTDDEYGGNQEVEKSLAKLPRLRAKTRHLRTASVGNSDVSYPKDKDGVSKSLLTSSLGLTSSKSKLMAGVSKTLPSRQIQMQTSLQLSLRGLMMGGSFDHEVLEEGDLDVSAKRPGSADNSSRSRQIFPQKGGQSNSNNTLGASKPVAPSTAEEGFHDYSPTPVNKGMLEDSLRGNPGSGDAAGVAGKVSNDGGSYGRNLSKGKKNSAMLGVALGTDAKAEGGRYDSRGRLKPINKSTDSNETTSSEGNGFSSKSSSQSDSSAGVMLGRGPLTRKNPHMVRGWRMTFLYWSDYLIYRKV